MKAIHFLASKSFSVVFFLIVAILAFITTGCGSLPGPPPPAFSGNTNVTVLLSSTANDQLSQFGLTFNSLTMTNKAGKSFTLLASPQGTEFVHLNGTIEPLITVSIPEGVYTSATASIGYAYFTCVTLIPATGTVPGGLLTATYAYGSTPNSQVSLHLPSPLTISGDHMGILVSMITSQSETLGSCYAPAGSANPYSITPTFEVTPVSFSGQGENSVEADLNGGISAVNAGANSFKMTLADGQSLSLIADNHTVFQGVADFSALTAGMLVNIDAVIRADGSQLVTRIGVENPSTTDLSVLAGPVLQTDPFGPTGSGPIGLVLGPQQQGLLSLNHEAAIVMPYNFNSSTFQISGTLANLQSLPFVPSFNNANIVPGQRVYVTTNVPKFAAYMPASTVTLIPQTVNGRVVASSTSGTFSVYTVSLAPYELFPALAVQQGQPTLLTNPSQVEVYVDSNAQKLNSSPLIPGSILRFRGLVFNDNGTLRMDCGQVFDGVAE
jgi:hypothetical protein